LAIVFQTIKKPLQQNYNFIFKNKFTTMSNLAAAAQQPFFSPHSFFLSFWGRNFAKKRIFKFSKIKWILLEVFDG